MINILTDINLPSTIDEPTSANNGTEGLENRRYDLNKDKSVAKKLQFTERDLCRRNRRWC